MLLFRWPFGSDGSLSRRICGKPEPLMSVTERDKDLSSDISAILDKVTIGCKMSYPLFDLPLIAHRSRPVVHYVDKRSEGDSACANCGRLPRHCLVQDTAQDSDRRTSRMEDYTNPLVLHAKGHVHKRCFRGEARLNSERFPHFG